MVRRYSSRLKVSSGDGDCLPGQESSPSGKGLRPAPQYGSKLAGEVTWGCNKFLFGYYTPRENGPEVFSNNRVVKELEGKVAELERLLGQKEWEIAIKKLFRPERMTTKAKVELVADTWQEHGLNRTLGVIELPKSTWYYPQKEKRSYEEKYSDLKPLIEEIIKDHPGYGYPRIKVTLEEEYGRLVSYKGLDRLLNLWELRLARRTRKAKRSPLRQAINKAEGELDLVEGREKIGSFEVAHTDFTEIPYDGGERKAQMIPIIGHRSKMIFGWAVGKHSYMDLAARAWERAKETFRVQGISWEGMVLHQDQDSVFTGNRWVDKVLIEDGVRLSYSQNGARGNTLMESFNGHFPLQMSEQVAPL